MKAAVTRRYGPPEVVEVREVETPTPTGDQIFVRVRAASVNRAGLDGLYPRSEFTRRVGCPLPPATDPPTTDPPATD